MRRPYRLGRRLESVDETRRRITAAAFELHASIGPSRTTIRAIAARAGVQRHTVYAHFPDLETLYVACTEHGIRVTGMPVAEPWAAISDPATRLRHGLREVFAWYRSNEGMLRNVLYDIDPTAPPPTEPDLFEIRLGALFGALADGWTVTTADDRPMLLAVLAHAMAFETWRSLTAGGLTDEQAVNLLASIVESVATGSIAIRG
ncbi:MAG: TetR/AcrR family transcriptional regulator [Dehalococcoidia bacterium]